MPVTYLAVSKKELRKRLAALKATVGQRPTSEADRKYNIQKVKLADVELQEVTAVTNNEADKSAVVEYTTTYKNPCGVR